MAVKMIENALLIAQIIVAASLIGFVLLQAKGSGVGSAFGGETVVYRSRRGVEKLLHYATIVTAVLLGLISLISVILRINS
jgi:preprotein translocase subunit SecG